GIRSSNNMQMRDGPHRRQVEDEGRSHRLTWRDRSAPVGDHILLGRWHRESGTEGTTPERNLDREPPLHRAAPQPAKAFHERALGQKPRPRAFAHEGTNHMLQDRTLVVSPLKLFHLARSALSADWQSLLRYHSRPRKYRSASDRMYQPKHAYRWPL